MESVFLLEECTGMQRIQIIPTEPQTVNKGAIFITFMVMLGMTLMTMLHCNDSKVQDQFGN